MKARNQYHFIGDKLPLRNTGVNYLANSILELGDIFLIACPSRSSEHRIKLGQGESHEHVIGIFEYRYNADAEIMLVLKYEITFADKIRSVAWAPSHVLKTCLAVALTSSIVVIAIDLKGRGSHQPITSIDLNASQYGILRYMQWEHQAYPPTLLAQTSKGLFRISIPIKQSKLVEDKSVIILPVTVNGSKVTGQVGYHESSKRLVFELERSIAIADINRLVRRGQTSIDLSYPLRNQLEISAPRSHVAAMVIAESFIVTVRADQQGGVSTFPASLTTATGISTKFAHVLPGQPISEALFVPSIALIADQGSHRSHSTSRNLIQALSTSDSMAEASTPASGSSTTFLDSLMNLARPHGGDRESARDSSKQSPSKQIAIYRPRYDDDEAVACMEMQVHCSLEIETDGDSGSGLGYELIAFFHDPASLTYIGDLIAVYSSSSAMMAGEPVIRIYQLTDKSIVKLGDLPIVRPQDCEDQLVCKGLRFINSSMILSLWAIKSASTHLASVSTFSPYSLWMLTTHLQQLETQTQASSSDVKSKEILPQLVKNTGQEGKVYPGLAEQLTRMQTMMMERFDRIDHTLREHFSSIAHLEDELKMIRAIMDNNHSGARSNGRSAAGRMPVEEVGELMG
jgi:hypothetical protein